MKKENLIISLLKSKESTTELFNDNHYDNKISDLRRIINRLRDILPKKDRKEIKDKLYKIEHQRNIPEKKEKETMNTLENEREFLIIKKNMVLVIAMIFIIME